MLGTTFRSAYEASKNLSRATSIAQAILGRNSSSNRRQASSVFGGFLQTLAYTRKDDVAAMFNCPRCEITMAGGKKTIRDGTATGILGELPQFTRPNIVLGAAKNTACVQFVLRNPGLRRYLDYFLTTSACSRESFFCP